MFKKEGVFFFLVPSRTQLWCFITDLNEEIYAVIRLHCDANQVALHTQDDTTELCPAAKHDTGADPPGGAAVCML